MRFDIVLFGFIEYKRIQDRQWAAFKEGLYPNTRVIGLTNNSEESNHDQKTQSVTIFSIIKQGDFTMRKNILFVFITIILTLGSITHGFAAVVSFEFIKVADTSTPIPGGIGNFERFDWASDVEAYGAGPSVHNGQVAFNGASFFNNGDQRGIYIWNTGTLSKIADRTTVVPGASAGLTFANFSNPVIENGQVAFTGNNSNGLYRTSGSSLIRVVDSSQTIPGGITGTFSAAGPAISNGGLAFRTGAGGGSIFKTENGQLVKIADNNTTVPGTTSTFSGAMSYPDIENGQVVFAGTLNSVAGGIYMGDGGNLTTIVNQDTPVPDAAVAGDTFIPNIGSSPVIDGGQVAFLGFGSDADDKGIYYYDGQSVQLIADAQTLLPNPLGTLTQFKNTFEDPAIDNGVIAFAAGAQSAVGSPGHPRGGIYSTFGGELGKVIDINDVLDGKDLAAVFMGQHGLDDDSLVFYAWFQDGSEGIYLAKANIDAVPVAVPNVVGQTQAAAQNALSAVGLVANIATASSSTVPAGTVISQNPAAGVSLAAGSSVNLVVSTGPALVVVPSVVGQTQAAAQNALSAVGLVANVSTASSSTVPAGSVISQNPAAGVSLAAGSSVNLVVSTGPALVVVPSVVGQTQVNAQSALVAVGLAANISTASSSTVPAGSIISQNPAAGVSLAAGSSVNLVVSSGPAQTIVGDVNGDSVVNCTDVRIVTASLGKRRGQSGYDPRADINNNGIVDLRDLIIVSRQLSPRALLGCVFR